MFCLFFFFLGHRNLLTGKMKSSAMLMMLQPMLRPRRPPTLAAKENILMYKIRDIFVKKITDKRWESVADIPLD